MISNNNSYSDLSTTTLRLQIKDTERALKKLERGPTLGSMALAVRAVHLQHLRQELDRRTTA